MIKLEQLNTLAININNWYENYFKSRYLVASLCIVGTSLLPDNTVFDKLRLVGCTLFAVMIYFHDEIEYISNIYDKDGIQGVIDEYYLYYESKYLVAKEQYEYYKDCI